MKYEVSLQKIRTQIVCYLPFFAAIGETLAHIQLGTEIETMGGEKMEVKTCATNGQDIVLNEEYMSQFPVKMQIFMVAQLVLALARRQHLMRNGRDPKVWAFAAAQCRLHEMKLWFEDAKDITRRVEFPESLEVMDDFVGMSEFEIYDAVMSEDQHSQLKQKLQSGEGDDSSGGAGDVCESPKMTGNPVRDAEVAQAQSANITKTLRQAEMRCRHAGKDHGFWAGLADQASDTGPDPESLLCQYVTNQFPTARTWQRPDPRIWAMGQYYPAEVKDNVGELVVALDCSGSMPRDEVAELISWIKNACVLCKPSKIHIIYFTGNIERHDVFGWNDEFKVPKEIPSGGTSFATVRAYIDQQTEKGNINALCEIWQTDGYDGFPDRPQNAADVIWMITTDVQPPDYGRYIQFHSKEAV